MHWLILLTIACGGPVDFPGHVHDAVLEAKCERLCPAASDTYVYIPPQGAQSTVWCMCSCDATTAQLGFYMPDVKTSFDEQVCRSLWASFVTRRC